MTKTATTLDQLCINTIRTLAIDAIQKANSGHPGLPMGAAPMAYVLWQRFLRHNPAAPDWPDRDRFVLSAGHGSMLLYALLHLTGYDLTMEDLKQFRQWGSRTPGHPEFGLTAGVEATTGPLGQGSANAVGMAIGERFLAHYFNRAGHDIVNHFTYVLAGDGDLMEGISAEAASLAGHLKLGKLIYLYDANDISLDGPTDLAFTEDVGARYAAYGWQVLTVKKGDTDLAAIHSAIEEARAEVERPSLIIVKTTIGYGSPAKQGTAGAHGAPLGEDEVTVTKKNLGWTGESFSVPEQAYDHFRQAKTVGAEAQSAWQRGFDAYAEAFPDLARDWALCQAGQLPADFATALPCFETGSKLATRVSSGRVLNALAESVPWLIGGDADLSCSTKTLIQNGGDFEGSGGAGRNIRYGVREHAMAAIANGLCYHGGVKTFTATFFCFADYMRPAIRLAAMSHLPTIFVFTHDSVAVGEDGPTHQPVEHLAAARVIPNHLVIRPADAGETTQAWCVALEQTRRPVSLVFSRQGLATIGGDQYGAASGLRKGAYVLAEAEGNKPSLILIATGAEVHLALEARKVLQQKGIATRVVSMPCWELFAEQDAAYRNDVLPPSVTARVAVEAGRSFGWERWVGEQGTMVTIDRFGASAPGNINLANLGFNVDNVVAKALGIL